MGHLRPLSPSLPVPCRSPFEHGERPPAVVLWTAAACSVIEESCLAARC